MSVSKKHVRFTLGREEFAEHEIESTEELIHHCSDNFLFYNVEDGYLEFSIYKAIDHGNIDIDVDEDNNIIKACWHGRAFESTDLKIPVKLNTKDMANSKNTQNDVDEIKNFLKELKGLVSKNMHKLWKSKEKGHLPGIVFHLNKSLENANIDQLNGFKTRQLMDKVRDIASDQEKKPRSKACFWKPNERADVTKSLIKTVANNTKKESLVTINTALLYAPGANFNCGMNSNNDNL